MTPMTPMREQPPCPPPKRYEWMSGPNGEGGHWVCVLPPKGARWASDHWEPWHGLQPAMGPNSCCCPRSLSIEGNGPETSTGDRSFRLRWPFHGSQSPSRPGRPCFGHSFQVNLSSFNIPHERNVDCKLEWWEHSDAPKFLGGDRWKPIGAHDMLRLTPTSETFDEWNVIRSPRYHRLPGGTDNFVLRDAPCDFAERFTLNKRAKPDTTHSRTLRGEVVYRSGCPQCEDLSLKWAQKVSFRDGELTALWFAAEEDKVVGALEPAEASTQVGSNADYARWARDVLSGPRRVEARG